jgi:hypothetical protein
MSKECRLVALGEGRVMKIAYQEIHPEVEEYLQKKHRCAYKKAKPFYKRFGFPLSDA